MGIYYCVFGVCSIILEIFFPYQLLSWLGFYARFLGKGLWFIFLGVLMMDPTIQDFHETYSFWAGLVLIVIGLVFCILHFIVGSPQPLVSKYSQDDQL